MDAAVVEFQNIVGVAAMRNVFVTVPHGESLNALVDEMNTPTTGRTLTVHRKTAVSFRDHALYQIFQIAITTLRQLQSRSLGILTPDQDNKMSGLALTLVNSCISFDFIGTNPEESAEDVGTVQVRMFSKKFRSFLLHVADIFF